jgi:HK97 family phage portal protein
MDNCARYNPSIDYVSEGGKSDTQKNFVWRKSVGQVKATEELEPVEHNHPIRKLFNHPNEMDSAFDFWSELKMFLDLTGNGFIWMVPNRLGFPQELWVVPSHWVWIQPGKDRFVDHWELRPWTGYAGAPAAKIPYRDLLHIRMKSPITKIDGYATTTGVAQWIDLMESANTYQWSNFKNQATPELHMELGPEYADPSDADLDRAYEKLFARFQGEHRAGLPIITGPGTKLNKLGFSPTEAAYIQTADQNRDNILSAFGTPKACIGLADTGTLGAVIAEQAAYCQWRLNPYLRMVAEAINHKLVPRFKDPREKRSIRVWWPDTTPDDPSQINSDIQVDMQALAICPDEVRQMRGRAPWPKGGKNPYAQAGLVEVPMVEDTPLAAKDPADLAQQKPSAEQIPEQQDYPMVPTGNRLRNGVHHRDGRV